MKFNKINNCFKGLLLLILITLNSNKSSSGSIKFKPKVIYESSSLIITQISANTFTHVSYKQTNDFGNVPCNGLLVRDKNEVIIFDTPTTDSCADELINFIKEKLNCKINAVIPTHFHDDCLGGLKAFHDKNIPSYANFKTIELAKQNNFIVPENGFSDSLILKVGDEFVYVNFFGEGHTKDNVVGYFSKEDIMFGGCLIKELKATKGYLADANLSSWSNTVEIVKKKYPNVKIVVPGHGKYGNYKLLDYTIELFRTQ